MLEFIKFLIYRIWEYFDYLKYQFIKVTQYSPKKYTNPYSSLEYNKLNGGKFFEKNYNQFDLCISNCYHGNYCYST